MIIDTCRCGATVIITHKYVADEHSRHRDWLDKHAVCRLHSAVKSDPPDYIQSRTGPQTPAPEVVEAMTCKTCVSYREPQVVMPYCNQDGVEIAAEMTACDLYERRTGC